MKQGWFGVLVAGILAAIMAPAIVLAANGNPFRHGQGFDAIIGGIEARYNTHATRIPFMGLISGIAGLSTHGGVSGMHVAEFDHMTEPVDGTELNKLVEERVGQGWQRMIRETSRHSDGGNADQTLIYVRDEHSRVGMLVVDLDGKELDVVQMSVNPDQLAREISRHEKHHGQDGDADSTNRGDKGEQE
jgi:hypothetical protein